MAKSRANLGDVRITLRDVKDTKDAVPTRDRVDLIDIGRSLLSGFDHWRFLYKL